VETLFESDCEKGESRDSQTRSVPYHGTYLIADQLTSETEIDRDYIVWLAWAHDLNRWPFAHNSEKGIFDQASDFPRYMKDAGIKVPDKWLTETQDIIDKKHESLNSEARIVLLADMITGFIEDPIWLTGILNITPEVIPKEVYEYLCILLEEENFLNELLDLHSHFRPKLDVVQFVEEFDKLFIEITRRFITTRNLARLSTLANPEFENNRYQIKEKFMRKVIFPYNNEKISQGARLQSELIRPMLDKLKSEAASHLTKITDEEFVQEAIDYSVLDKNNTECYQPLLDYMNNFEPENSFQTYMEKNMILDADEAIGQLSKVVGDRTLIPFCGAGVSRGSGLPTAHEFLEKYELEDLSWSQAATVITKSPTFMQEFNNIFGNNDLSPSKQHRLLASLDAPFYVTTNYDIQLERALRGLFGQSNKKTIGVLRNLKDISDIYTYRNLVVKLHGDVKDTDLLIFDGSQYMARWKSPTLVDSFVAHLFATHTVLFVGYSLNDEHIVEMLRERLENASPSLPPKFIVVEDITPNKEKFYSQANIMPIVLKKNNYEFDDAVCEFLYRLWETKGNSGIYTKLVEKEKYPPHKKLKLAISFRQLNNLSEADRLLKDLRSNKQYLADLECLDLVDSYLWLNVSVLDKMEKWDKLIDEDETHIAALFSGLKENLPVQIYMHLRTCYQASMAIAFLRKGDRNEALKRAQESIKWFCTETADISLKIIHANANAYAYVSHALCCVYIWRLDKGDSELVRQAIGSLEKSRKLLASIIDENGSNGCHHLGRYYGAMVFTQIAQYDELRKKGVGLNEISIDEETLTGNSYNSHSPHEERTKFGRIAGLYCEAFSRYWLARNNGDEHNQLVKAQVALKEILESIDEGQIKARDKVNRLNDEINEILNGNLNEPKDYQWLALPIN